VNRIRCPSQLHGERRFRGGAGGCDFHPLHHVGQINQVGHDPAHVVLHQQGGDYGDIILISLAINRLIEPVFSYPRRALKSKFLSFNIEQIDSLSEVDQSLT